MAVVVATDAPGCFGKLPGRGDFVRTPDQHALMLTLDRWAGGSIELLARNPDWKRLYDTALPMHFAFLGSRSRHGIGGHFVTSRDASHRRFPFLAATRFQTSAPLAFIGRSPLALSRLWSALGRFAREAVAADDPGDALRSLGDLRIAVSSDPQDYDAPFSDFADLQGMGALQRLLRETGHPRLRLDQVLPALGLLMQPLIVGGPGRIDKALALPLPRDTLYRPLVAAYWLDLIGGFLGRAEFELVLLLQEGDQSVAPRLLVGFNGADPRTLHAALDPQVAEDQIIRVADADWVQDELDGDYALNRLASFLGHDDLPLRLARGYFNETFLGT